MRRGSCSPALYDAWLALSLPHIIAQDSGDLAACAVQSGGDGRFADMERAARLGVGQPADVDGDQRLAERVGQRGDRGEERLRVDRRLRAPGRASVLRLGGL